MLEYVILVRERNGTADEFTCIQIQRKRRPFWPWLVGLAAGLLLVWLLFRTWGKQQDPGEFEPIPNSTTTERADTVVAPL